MTIERCEVCKPRGITCERIPGNPDYRKRTGNIFDGRRQKIEVWGTIEKCLTKPESIARRQQQDESRGK